MSRVMMLVVGVLVLMQVAHSAFLPGTSDKSVNRGKEKVLPEGPKVAIKSLALNAPNSFKRRMTNGSGGNLHEIFITPYRYIEKEMRAVVNLVGVEDQRHNKSEVKGVILLKQETPEGGLTIIGNVSGLNPGQKHGIHVHEFGDLRGGCGAGRTGHHFNPYSFGHGAPPSRQRHAGDLGNIQADEKGQAVFTLTDKVLSLVGARNIIGRSIVIDRTEDDGKEQVASFPAACGVIGRTY